MAPTLEEIRQVPKSLLHDHLDGGLRTSTILDLADRIGHPLPAWTEPDLKDWFTRGANTLDLNQYLATFEHTMAVMQTAEDCHRVAAEAALDLAADGVVYAEVRFAPENHTAGHLGLDDVMEAVQAGFRSGCATAADSGHSIVLNTIVCAMRQCDRSSEVAAVALEWRDRDHRVVAFDLAGPETGFPPTDHPAALTAIREGHMHLTLHASEPPGLELISQALACGAERVGHGVRLYDDITTEPDGQLRLGALAGYVLTRQVHLEMAPSCHVHVGAVETFADHPLASWHRHGFSVSVNTDNRLMSNVSVSSEFHRLTETFELTWQEIEALTTASIQAGFGSYHERQSLIRDVVLPGYAALR